MRNLLQWTNPSGHLELVWDPTNPADVERARAEIATLKAAGYSFFSVVGTDDPLAVGHGKLILERIAEPEAAILAPPTQTDVAATESVGRKGRRKTPLAELPGRRTVAVPQQRGG